MKSKIVIFLGCLLLCSGSILNKNGEAPENLPAKDSLTVFCSPDLYNLTTKWVAEFSISHPDNNIRVINATESYFAEYPDINRNLGFISGDYAKMYERSSWNTVVGRDVLIPIYNSENPFLKDISRQGVTLEEIALIFSNPEERKWGSILKNQENMPVNLYMIDDESAKSGLEKLLNTGKIEFDGIKIKHENEFYPSVQNDPYSIGICRMATLLASGSQNMLGNIRLLPIDRNGNGEIDYMEKIYDDLNVLARSVWIGKYPKVLFNNIYSISPSMPTSKVEVEFIKWVLTDGQQFLNDYGYSDLILSERQSKVEMLTDNTIDIVKTEINSTSAKTILIILVSFTVIIFIVFRIMRYTRKRIGLNTEIGFSYGRVLNEDFADVPLGLYYDKTHTWVFMEKNGLVRIGIDDFLQHITGPLTRVILKNAGEKIRKGKQVMSIIHNGKQLNLYAPISGTIKEFNRVLDTDSSVINSSPYSDGWIYMIEPANWLKEVQFLLMGKKYNDWLKTEFSRLKEFFSVFARHNDTISLAPVLQDGGELKDGILADFGPEIWEDFQTNFIDLSA